MPGTPISSIRNLGPAMEGAFARAGIMDAESLRDLGADAAYQRLLELGERPHFIGYYVLVMALQGRPWNDAKGDEKTALRARFDALKDRAAQARATQKGRVPVDAALERILNELGVIAGQPTSSRPAKK